MNLERDGGPAFPMVFVCEEGSNMPNGDTVPKGERQQYILSGMSLRDWFAGQALVGMRLGFSNQGYPTERIASDCYEIADALLKARLS